MTTIRDIISLIEDFAPSALQESYDNCGLQVGDATLECTGALLCVDARPEIVEEAKRKGLNLIICHHPLFFKGLKRIIGNTQVEKTAWAAIKHDIAIYASHTSLDNARGGVSFSMAEALGLNNIRFLSPQDDKILKLSVWIPRAHALDLRDQLFMAGCGQLGNYDNCSFSVEGTGTFRPLEGSCPADGTINALHSGEEVRLELLLPRWIKSKVEETILLNHPYEEPAYEFSSVTIGTKSSGLGAVGELSSPITAVSLIERIKSTFNSPVVRCNRFDIHTPVRKVALCGGSGSSFIENAIREKAQVYITSDTGYHAFVDYADKILIADIGHFESENCAKNIFYGIIKEKFPNFAVEYSKTESNPIIYR
ncbi:MAG: Nif3-like dinuclear metal center hexameric protein [Paramuribaculum sp.]|nr:Nif3-like dinuclear metal center hexameric protein [Paramuribaculum sp.]